MADKPRIKSVEPSDSKDKEKHSFFYGIPIRGGSLLRKKLKLSESSYHFIWGPNSSVPRDYYLYGVFNETDKAGISMMQHAEFVRDSKANYDPAKHQSDQRLSDNILQSHIDELTIWQRKTTEMLIDLVGFGGANSEDYYRHYITVHELAEKRKIQKDFQNFYNCNNSNLAHQIKDLEQRAAQLVAKLEPKKCWYVKIKQERITTGLNNFEKRFKAVFPLMKDEQKAALLTYGMSFGRQSEMLHPVKLPRERQKPLDLDSVDTHISRIGILSLHVIAAAKDLMHIHNVKGFLKTIADLAKKNKYPVSLFKKQTKPPIEQGDFVVAYGDLAQVTKVIRSKYGYKTFRVRYLEQPPLPHIKEDEFTAQYVHLLYKLKPVTAQVRSLLLKDTPNEKPSTRNINEAIRKSVLHFWSIGGKEIVLGRPEEGYKKMSEYLEAEKAKHDKLK